MASTYYETSSLFDDISLVADHINFHRSIVVNTLSTTRAYLISRGFYSFSLSQILLDTASSIMNTHQIEFTVFDS